MSDQETCHYCQHKLGSSPDCANCGNWRRMGAEQRLGLKPPYKEYVCGFMFNSDALTSKKGAVALILKVKPDWQKGKHNGIGGHIEWSDHNPLAAMVRE